MCVCVCEEYFVKVKCAHVQISSIYYITLTDTPNNIIAFANMHQRHHYFEEERKKAAASKPRAITPQKKKMLWDKAYLWTYLQYIVKAGRYGRSLGSLRNWWSRAQFWWKVPHQYEFQFTLNQLRQLTTNNSRATRWRQTGAVLHYAQKFNITLYFRERERERERIV